MGSGLSLSSPTLSPLPASAQLCVPVSCSSHPPCRYAACALCSSFHLRERERLAGTGPLRQLHRVTNSSRSRYARPVRPAFPKPRPQPWRRLQSTSFFVVCVCVCACAPRSREVKREPRCGQDPAPAPELKSRHAFFRLLCLRLVHRPTEPRPHLFHAYLPTHRLAVIAYRHHGGLLSQAL